MSYFNEALVCVILGVICLHTLSCGAAEVPVEADLVLLSGKVWTVDQNKPTAEAVAVWNGRILAVGANGEIEKLTGPHTKVIDLQGKLVLPGFTDSHTHFVAGGFYLLGAKWPGNADHVRSWPSHRRNRPLRGRVRCFRCPGCYSH